MLPNLLIIGAFKAGTTSLHNYLGLHPDIFMSGEKELRFFVKEKNWSKGLLWYESNFRDVNNEKIIGESSPGYTDFPANKGVPKRIYSLIPKGNFIYILRDPIERIISHYKHFVLSGWEKCTIEEALKEDENNHYICNSMYFLQIEQYLPFFEEYQFLFITSEELKNKRSETMKKVFHFLEVDENFSHIKFSEEAHVTAQQYIVSPIRRYLYLHFKYQKAKKIVPKIIIDFLNHLTLKPIETPKFSNDTFNKLRNIIQPDVNKLRKFLDMELKDWCL